MTAKITLVASQTPKEVIREIIREPAVIPTQSRHHSLAHAISISNDDSSLSSGQLKSIEEIPNLAALLKKILKSRKVHYSESAPKQAEAELNEKKKVKEANVRSGSISKHIERLEAELYEKKRLLKKEVKAELGHLENRRAESRNVATSPPNETFVYQSSKFEEKKPTAIESTHRQNLYEEPQHVRASQTYLNERDLFNSRDSYLRRENYVEISEQDPPRPTYSYRKERGNASDHVKPRKSKSRSKSDYSICECSTCSENVSWVCPGCVSEESSIRQPRTNYFDDDTSMIRPLAEIVSDLENERKSIN